jgi:predicted PurR-regulated permease PerM
MTESSSAVSSSAVLAAVRPHDEERRQEDAQREMELIRPSVATVCLVVLTVLATFGALYAAAAIVLPILLALVLNLLLQPARRLLTDSLKLPAVLAALILLVALVCIVAGLAAAVSVPASGWLAKAPQSLPTLEQRIGAFKQPFEFLRHGLEQVQNLMQQPPPEGEQRVVVEQQSNLGGVGMTLLAGTRAALGQVLTLVVVLFFMLSAGDSLLRSFVEIVPGFTEKRRVVEIAVEIERNISGYLVTITLMNLLVGVANGLSMWLQGIPDPLLWGSLAFLLNYIPILGPLTGVAIFFFVGLFSSSSLVWALLPPGIYLLIHVIEGETVTPMLLARRFTLNAVLVIVSLFFWDWLWGVPGALLSVPLLAILKIVCDRVPALMPLGHLLGAPAKASAKRA